MTLLQQAQRIIADMLSELCGRRVSPDELSPITAGASGRILLRGAGRLGIYWTGERADNNSFLPAAHGLARAGVPVPAVLAERSLPEACGACIVTDLGPCELVRLRDADWPTRRDAWLAAFRTLHRLDALRPDWPLQPPFDTELYRWEQSYFAEHLLARHLGADARAFLKSAPLRLMAERLSALPRVPVHRDCQSPNIMIRDGVAWLVDFQGMRMGRREYDLASLLFDAHMPMQPDERRELLRAWEGISGQPVDIEIFAACALQRIMQALGAYANIGYNQGKPAYLRLIPIGLRHLREAVALIPPASPTASVIPCLPAAITAGPACSC